MLKVQNLSISFGGKNIFDDINFIINPGEKVGLIGRNGCGKSTLFKILCGKITDYEGEIVIPKNYRIGYLEQHLHFTEDTIIDEACKALPEYKKEARWDAEKILSELDFSEDDKLKSPSEFSGGWQIRLNLAKLLISEPDILLLDEPTNYLDIISIRWLKGFLKNYKGTLMLITHDRSFMDDIIDHTIIINRGTSIEITGNTQDMYGKIAVDEETYEKSRINENKKREQIQKYIDRFRAKATLAKQVKSKEKMLARQEKKEELQNIDNLDFSFKYSGFIGNSNMLEVEDLSFGYDYKEMLFTGLNFKVEQGDKVCVIGKNGKGKSTLLKLLIGAIKQINGIIKLNTKTEICYFGQMNVDLLKPNNTIEAELQSVDILIPRTKILATAGKMLFSGDDTQKRISVLSGGEKNRVMLGKILLKPCNLLVLDEPTNHLDMESCEALSDAILEFEGASIIVSHNEYLLNNIATKLIIFDAGKVFLFEGNYADFLKKVGWQNEISEKKLKLNKSNDNGIKKTKIINSDKELKKLENLIIEKEILMEELIKKEDYKGCAILQEELDKLNNQYNEMTKN